MPQMAWLSEIPYVKTLILGFVFENPVMSFGRVHRRSGYLFLSQDLATPPHSTGSDTEQICAMIRSDCNDCILKSFMAVTCCTARRDGAKPPWEGIHGNAYCQAALLRSGTNHSARLERRLCTSVAFQSLSWPKESSDFTRIWKEPIIRLFRDCILKNKEQKSREEVILLLLMDFLSLIFMVTFTTDRSCWIRL